MLSNAVCVSYCDHPRSATIAESAIGASIFFLFLLRAFVFAAAAAAEMRIRTQHNMRASMRKFSHACPHAR